MTTESANWSTFTWAGLVLTPLLISGGQVLFKYVSTRLLAVDVASLRLMVVDPFFIAAMIVYAAATVLWILVLRAVPLGAAYSFVALGFIFVPVLSFALFAEPLTVRYFTGTAVVLAGLYLIHS